MKCLLALCALFACCIDTAFAKTVEIHGTGLTVRVDDQSGDYSIHRQQPAQDWSGSRVRRSRNVRLAARKTPTASTNAFAWVGMPMGK